MAPAQEMLMKKAIKAYYAMQNILFSNKITHIRNHITAYSALVEPILLYGCEIWGVEALENKSNQKFLSGQHHILGAEKLEIKLYKFLLGVPNGTSNIGVRSEIAYTPMRIRVVSQILKFYYRMKLGSVNTLLDQTFINVSNIGINPFSKILALLADCKIPLPNPKQPHEIKQRVKKVVPHAETIMMENWDIGITKNRKLETYDKIKESHDREGYLDFVNDRNLRKYLSLLRLSCHSLAIETGRYKNIPREERLCIFCQLDEIEDEQHFIFCPLYEQLRIELFTSLDGTNNTRWQNLTNKIDRFSYILQPDNKEMALLVCKYVKACFELRKNNT